jgi:hypothetical protein
MNITLRCRGSKREQARPPICAAGRRAHRRAGCRGDQSNAALNAPVRPNRQHSYRCRGSCSWSCQAGAAPPRRATSASFSVSWASWVSTTSPSNAPSSLSGVARSSRSRARSGRRRASIAAHVRSAVFGVLSGIGTPSSLDVQQIVDHRRAISAFAVDLGPSASE